MRGTNASFFYLGRIQIFRKTSSPGIYGTYVYPGYKQGVITIKTSNLHKKHLIPSFSLFGAISAQFNFCNVVYLIFNILSCSEKKNRGARRTSVLIPHWAWRIKMQGHPLLGRNERVNQGPFLLNQIQYASIDYFKQIVSQHALHPNCSEAFV